MSSALVRAGGAALLFAVFPVASAFTTSGCSNCGRGKGELVDFAGGETTGNEYQSSPRNGPYVPFPSGARIRFLHDLPSPPTPGTIEIRLGFEEAGNLADTAGNLAILDNVDEEAIEIEADTCADHFIYVYARASDLTE